MKRARIAECSKRIQFYLQHFVASLCTCRLRASLVWLSTTIVCSPVDFVPFTIASIPERWWRGVSQETPVHSSHWCTSIFLSCNCWVAVWRIAGFCVTLDAAVAQHICVRRGPFRTFTGGTALTRQLPTLAHCLCHCDPRRELQAQQRPTDKLSCCAWMNYMRIWLNSCHTRTQHLREQMSAQTFKSEVRVPKH